MNDLLITGAAVVFVGALFALLVRAKDFQAPRPATPVASEPEILTEAAT
jgi:hypothetical protein